MTEDPWRRWISAEGVPSAYAAARDGIDVVLRDRGLRRTSPETTAESLLRGAHASAVLEGSASSLAEVRESGGDDVARAAVRVSAELLSLTPRASTAPLQVFARLHTLAAAGSLPEDRRQRGGGADELDRDDRRQRGGGADELGRYDRRQRGGGADELDRYNRIGRPRDEESALVLRTLASAMTVETSAPALLVAAMVHGSLASSAPFASHNGIVARAAERLLLVARGVDEKSLIVPEAGHLALRPAYESNLRAFRDGGEAGVHAWLLYAAEAYAAAAEASPLRRAAAD